ncbi:single-stranded DNA-binding protein [Bulleidia sp. zg-1006]|uniref:single-stranded DNA-binding protein n=1 Tax=Bulleidia sp. zg-1006 TaxID=2806552 RepID=UPI00193A3A93|nr:single-stranded DNA-binding protein [Bulleidia sp. zg-1006]QRG86071.1 single-stranded DNA-binding protein [Bulleidia sp. zg-1006]
MSWITIFGRVCQDMQLEQTANGNHVVNFSIAEKDGKDKNNNTMTSFYRMVAYGKTAENLHHFIKKGDLLLVRGTGRMSTYMKNDKNMTVFTVTVDSYKFIPSMKTKLETKLENKEEDGNKDDEDKQEEKDEPDDTVVEESFDFEEWMDE